MKKLTSIFFMGLATALAVLAVLTMFLPFLEVNGSVVSAASVFWSSGARTIKGAWPSFVGFMLILASAIALLVLSLPFVQPSAKVEKIVLISLLSALTLGFILVALTAVFYSSFNPVEVSHIVLYPGYYIFMILTLCSIGSTLRALVLDW